MYIVLNALIIHGGSILMEKSFIFGPKIVLCFTVISQCYYYHVYFVASVPVLFISVFYTMFDWLVCPLAHFVETYHC